MEIILWIRRLDIVCCSARHIIFSVLRTRSEWDFELQIEADGLIRSLLLWLCSFVVMVSGYRTILKVQTKLIVDDHQHHILALIKRPSPNRKQNHVTKIDSLVIQPKYNQAVSERL